MGVFLELGKAIAASGKAVEHIAEGYSKVLGGVGGAIDTLGHDLVESQRIRHETTRLREQQSFLLRYQRDRAEIGEAAHAAGHLRHLEAAELKHRLRQQDRVHQVQTTLLRITELDRLERSMANNPFRYDTARVFADARRETEDGRRPVLFVAPFVGDPDDPGMAGEVLACTDRLIRSEVTGRLGGAFRRPLDLLDTDVNTVRDALDGLPGILVNGEFDRHGRISVTVTGWDLIGVDTDDGTPPRFSIHRTVLPPVDFPSGPFSARKQRQSRHDVSVAAVFLAAAYAELFHVARGRLPELYADMPVELRSDVAVGSAAMLDIAVARDLIDPVDASLAQAGVYLDVGLDDRARDLLNEVLAILVDEDAEAVDKISFLDRVHRTRTLLIRAGLNEEAERLDGRAAPVARDELSGRFPWGP